MLGVLIIAIALGALEANIPDANHPNVIIVHLENLLWSDLGFHVNRRDSENSTPNIDRLAYSGIILNRFYANGGLNALLSGCYQRSRYGNPNLMTFYFERNGYDVNFVSRHNFDKIEAFEQGVLDAVSDDNKPFLSVVDFGHLGTDMKIPFVDEIIGAMTMKAHAVGALNNTILLFVSLPDDGDESPLESHIRRTAFVYSPLLAHQQRVSNQIIHAIDLLPTLVNATNLKWRTRDRIFIDGLNQWQALSDNDDERLSVFGDNFYINGNWKLAFGASGSYGSIENELMEADEDSAQFDFETYVKSIMSSEIHHMLDSLSSERIMFSRNRARVHCNLKDVDETAVKRIKCSRSSPCLFNLLEDPCEFDNKYEHEFDLRRTQMRELFERYLSGEKVDEVTMKKSSSSAASNPDDDDDDGTVVGIILGSLVFVCIFIFIIVVCVKERCNRKRSVYIDKSLEKSKKKSKAEAKLKAHENGNASDPNGISIISSNI